MSQSNLQRRLRRGSRRRNPFPTRVVFFIVLAVFLGIVAFSLATQVIDAAFLAQAYIAATIFAAGVFVVDFMGLLGDHEHHGGEESGGEHAAGLDEGHAGDVGDGNGADMYGEAAAHDGDHGGDAGIGEAFQGSQLGGTIVDTIRYLRLFVYFCLAFGPVGLASSAAGMSAQLGFALASAAGLVAIMLARLFFRLRPRDTGELMATGELLHEQGTVTVPLTHTVMGRVRLQVGMSVVELYALAAQEDEEFGRGALVRIVKVTDDCVYVA